MSFSLVAASFSCVLFLVSWSHGARILGISPSPFLSHQTPYQVIMKALAARGHQVTSISCFPLKMPVENYADIDLSISLKHWESLFDFVDKSDVSEVEVVFLLSRAFHKLGEFHLSTSQLQSFINSSEATFDLVIMEKLMYQSFYGIVHRFGSPPVIGYVSMGGLPSTFEAYGIPPHPAYFPDLWTSYADHMNFWERAYNTWFTFTMLLYWHFFVLPYEENLMRKHFGSGPPSLYDSVYNDSLLLTNHHWTLNYPAPMPPSVVQLTGLHIETTTKPLPKNIQDFLDAAENGAVYFSLGSNVMTNMLPEDKLKHILEAISELPQHVILKWELDTLPGKPSNVMIGKWLPQQDILAHPNVRVFVTHGGLQSFQEAVYHGVPLLGIPFLGDQHYNTAKFVDAHIGLALKLNDLTKDTFLQAIGQILNDSYRESMKTFSKVYRDHQEHSLDDAIYWIEYVLRYKGARHLRSAALDLSWYQYMLLDIIAALFFVIILTVTVSYILFRKIVYIYKVHFIHTKLKNQ